MNICRRFNDNLAFNCCALSEGKMWPDDYKLEKCQKSTKIMKTILWGPWTTTARLMLVWLILQALKQTVMWCYYNIHSHWQFIIPERRKLKHDEHSLLSELRWTGKNAKLSVSSAALAEWSPLHRDNPSPDRYTDEPAASWPLFHRTLLTDHRSACCFVLLCGIHLLTS